MSIVHHFFDANPRVDQCVLANPVAYGLVIGAGVGHIHVSVQVCANILSLLVSHQVIPHKVAVGVIVGHEFVGALSGAMPI